MLAPYYGGAILNENSSSICCLLEHSRADWLLRLLGASAGTLKVENHARFISNYPGIMSRRSNGEVTKAEILLRSICHLDRHPPRNDVRKVRNLATLRANDRLDMF